MEPHKEPYPGNKSIPDFGIDVVLLSLDQTRKEGFDDRYRTMRTNHPNIARFLMRAAEKNSPGDLQRKRDFAAGVLALYELMIRQHEIARLEEGLTLGDGDGADLQP